MFEGLEITIFNTTWDTVNEKFGAHIRFIVPYEFNESFDYVEISSGADAVCLNRFHKLFPTGSTLGGELYGNNYFDENSFVGGCLHTSATKITLLAIHNPLADKYGTLTTEEYDRSIAWTVIDIVE